MADALIGGFTGLDFTIECAFKTSGLATDDVLMGKSTNTTEWSIAISSVSSGVAVLLLTIYKDDDTAFQWSVTNNLVVDTAWHYLSIRLDSTDSLTVLIDNVPAGETVVGLSTLLSGVTWRTDPYSVFVVGNSAIGGANPWQGEIDEIAIYQKAITDSEREQNYSWWVDNAAGQIYGDVTTELFSTDFGLTSLVGSYRGDRQFRQNFRSSDVTFTGLLGDYAVGVPAPVVAPTVNIDVEGDPLDLETDTRFYLMTYVNRFGYESAPGPVTASATYVGASSNVTISFPKYSKIAYHPAVYGKEVLQDYVPIVSARFYRTNTGTAETGFQFIAEQPIVRGEGTFPDVENDELAELLITDSWDVPPPIITSGCKMATGVYVLVHDYNVYMSVPGVTYAFPQLYNRVIKHKALHVEAIGTSAILLTDGGPYLIVGSSPDVMEVVNLPFYQVVESTRAVSTYLDMVIYPAQDGLIGVDSNGRVTNLTEGIFEEDQWRDEIPLTNLFSEVHDSVYYAFYDGVSEGAIGFFFNLRSKEFGWLDSDLIGATTGDGALKGMYYDTSTDSLYFSEEGTNVLSEWQPHVVTFEAPPATDPILAATPVSYWRFDETSGLVFSDEMGNNDATIQTSPFGSAAADVSVSSETGLRATGNSYSAKGANTGDDSEMLVLADGGAHADVNRIMRTGSDWTFFGLATLDVDPTTVLGAGERMMFLWHGSIDGVVMTLRWDYDTDDLLLQWDRVTDGTVTLVTDFTTLLPAYGTSFCWRLEGSTTGEYVKFFIGATEVGSYDTSGVANWIATPGYWLWDTSISYSTFGPTLGATAGDTSTGYNWLGRFDDVAYFERSVTAQEASDFCAGEVAAIPPPNPVPWRWWTKEFIIPNRSYGAAKIMGRLDVDNAIQVTLECDGVDQTLFPLHAGAADGIAISEAVFRLPPIRSQRMRLKLETSTGSPVVESIQVSVHPMEIV